MVWDCMMRNCIDHIALFNERLNAEKYICILENALVPTTYEFELVHGDVTLIHDNASAYLAKSVQNWLKHNDYSSLKPGSQCDAGTYYIQSTSHLATSERA